jgi:phosphoglycerol geranylgeranyltransferase
LITKNQKSLAILIDPEKVNLQEIQNLCTKINLSPAAYIFVGGSTVESGLTDLVIQELKKYVQIPIVIFPGHPSQISNHADALLFLSLLSGRNTDYLIEHHINSVEILEKSNLEIIPTAYILIDGGTETSVQKVSKTKPIDRHNIELAYKTAKAGELLGKKLIYLEAGSGAKNNVPFEMVKNITEKVSIPVIVGGGIKDYKTAQEMYENGASVVVVGTAFEKNDNFFEEWK